MLSYRHDRRLSYDILQTINPADFVYAAKNVSATVPTTLQLSTRAET